MGIVGGVALIACAAAEPCGVLATGSVLAKAASATGALMTAIGSGLAIWDVSSSNVNLTQTYPVMLIPDQTFPGPQQAWPYHISSPEGVYR